ncbi:hypothetical protein RM555_26900 [Micromonospora sp. DSM 115977]|uniref:Uncharacterized protein n=1 Tax=Micromonospora reichwaldensis TaxID=3075516 RepID=A0ABU2X363_9ACTN|nr:hypothetical protein [Micromonospora sp. DSM 115977]MDT0532632.1 hypothetical protein [Micromonospora sp. DSM 115977]
MVRSIKDLRATPDDVLIAEHDRHARDTHVGAGYYVDELERRERRRAIEASDRLARRALRLAWSNTLLAAVAALAAVVALFK